MIGLIKYKDYSGIAFYLLCAVLIGWQEMVAPAIGLVVLFLIGDILVSKKYKFFFSTNQLLFVVLFLFYMLGLSWSEHADIGWKLLEYKMSFFIFPLLFSMRKEQQFYHLILRGFLFGNYVLLLRLLYGAFVTNDDLSFYEISRQNVLIHPTYVCIYFSLGIFIAWYLYFGKRTTINLMSAVIATALFGFVTVGSQSLAGILFLILLLAAIPGYLIYLKFKFWGLIGYIIVIPIVSYFVITNLSFLKYDLETFASIKNEITLGKEGFLEANKNSISGNKERVVMWYISTEIIVENPLGVGLGDIDFAIAEKAEKYKLTVIQQTPLNPHNQFLQIGIDLGLPGMIYLIGMIIYYCYYGFKKINPILIFAIASLTFNAMFESVLQRQSGIVFYTLLVCLALCISESKLPNKQIIKAE